MTAEQGIYPINNPDENSPVLVTCNFSLTYFIVSGEIESSRVPCLALRAGYRRAVGHDRLGGREVLR